MDTTIVSALVAFGVATATPGPATMAVSTTAMASGSRAALALGVGLAVGLAAWGAVAAAGVGALLAQSAAAMTALRWCGGAYLLWLAWQSARAASSGLRELESTVSVSTFQQLHRGLLLNLSNPKAPMAWVSILALGSPSAGQDVGIWLQAGMCSLLGLTIYVVYSIAFSRSPVRAAYRASRRAIEGVAAGLFAFFGLRLLLARTES